MSEEKLRELNPLGLPIADVAHLLGVRTSQLQKLYFGLTINHQAPDGQPIISWDDIEQARRFLVNRPADVPDEMIPYSLFADIEALKNAIATVRADIDDDDLKQYQNYLGSRKVALENLHDLLDPDNGFVAAVDEVFDSLHGQYN